MTDAPRPEPAAASAAAGAPSVPGTPRAPGPGDPALARLAAELRARDADLVALRAALAEARAEAAALRASTSWRITAPLRAVVLALRRMAGSRRG